MVGVAFICCTFVAKIKCLYQQYFKTGVWTVVTDRPVHETVNGLYRCKNTDIIGCILQI